MAIALGHPEVNGLDEFTSALLQHSGVEYGTPIAEFGMDDFEVEDEQAVLLSDIIPGDQFKFTYLYDFGDSWEHDILVEKCLKLILQSFIRFVFKVSEPVRLRTVVEYGDMRSF